MLFISELGDRTFIVTTIFAARLNTFFLFLVGSVAMASMHTISTLIGAAAPLLLSSNVTQIITVVLFFAFGIQLIYSGIKATDEDAAEEEEEVLKAVEEHDAHHSGYE